jgi:putative peptide zinc metalloprotease protein
MPNHPKFRSDLEPIEQRDSEGRRIIVLRDPVSQQYFRLSYYEFLFLSALDGNLSPESASEKLKERGYYYSEEDVGHIVSRAAQEGLLLGTRFGTAGYQISLKNRVVAAQKARRLAGVYFLFIPILNPDRFLERTLWVFRLLCNRWTSALAVLSFPGALYLIISGLPRIEREFLFFFNLHNLMYLWVTIALTKLIHEFAHAYTAKKYGLHVPQMGIAFLIFFPCLYCDTTDAWQLADRKQRMAISGAGVFAEAVLATISAYVWYFSKPGIVNSLAFYLMGVALLSTLLFNGNPLLKFDGYFIFSDYLGLPNLYGKSFAHLRYLFMNKLLGIKTYTQVAANPREKLIFTSYGTASFAYRIILYVTIVVGVYYRFDKTVGVVLAGFAFALFVVRPVSRGVKSLWKHRKSIRPSPVSGMVLVCLLALPAGLLFVPVHRNSVYPCFLDTARKQKLTVPLHTWVSNVYIQEGTEVTEGSVLFTLDTSLLELTLFKTETKRAILEKELELLRLQEKERAEAPSKEIELLQAEDEIEEIKGELDLAQHGSIAPFPGVVTWFDPRMKPGFQPGEGSVIGELESVMDCMVHALVPEGDLEKIRPGQKVQVWFPINGGREFCRTILDVKPFSERDLHESPFSSRFGGELATETKSKGRQDVPLEAQYDCSVKFPNQSLMIPLGMTGRLVVFSPPQSILAMVIDSLVRTFNRESLL